MVAEQSVFDAGVLTSLVGAGTTIGFIIITLIVIAVFGALAWYVMRQFFMYKDDVIYFYKDSYNNTKVGFDKASTSTKYKQTKFWLKKHKIGLDVDKINFAEWGKKKIAFFIKYGEKSFRPLNFILSDVGVRIKVGEEDVNWAITQLNIEAKRFDFKSWLKEFGPMVMWVMFSMFILIAIIVLLNKFEILADVAISLERVTENIQRASIGGDIIQ